MFAGLGHYVIEVKVDNSAVVGILSSLGSWTYEAYRFSNLVASRPDCSRRCETDEDPERAEFGRHVDAYAGRERAGGIFWH